MVHTSAAELNRDNPEPDGDHHDPHPHRSRRRPRSHGRRQLRFRRPEARPQRVRHRRRLRPQHELPSGRRVMLARTRPRATRSSLYDDSVSVSLQASAAVSGQRAVLRVSAQLQRAARTSKSPELNLPIVMPAHAGIQHSPVVLRIEALAITGYPPARERREFSSQCLQESFQQVNCLTPRCRASAHCARVSHDRYRGDLA